MSASTLLRLTRNLGWGLAAGLFFGVTYSLLGSLAFVLGGDRSTERYGMSVRQVIWFYLAAGLLGGTIVGLLRPLLRYKEGAMVAGFLAAIPAAVAFHYVRNGESRSPGANLILALLLGPATGWAIWDRTRPD